MKQQEPLEQITKAIQEDYTAESDACALFDTLIQNVTGTADRLSFFSQILLTILKERILLGSMGQYRGQLTNSKQMMDMKRRFFILIGRLRR